MLGVCEFNLVFISASHTIEFFFFNFKLFHFLSFFFFKDSEIERKSFYLFIYLWLCWVFVSVRGPSPAVTSGRHSSLRCTDLSLSRRLLLRSTGSRRAGSVIVAHRPSCSAACGILPDQGLEPVSPALAGRFSTTAPPGKPPHNWILSVIFSEIGFF